MKIQRRKRIRPALLMATATVAAPFAIAGVAGIKAAVAAALAERRGTPMLQDVPNPPPSVGFVASVALDELVLQAAAIHSSATSGDHYRRSSTELDLAVRYYDSNGLLRNSDDYFSPPPPPQNVRAKTVHTRRGPLEVVQFQSDWRPRPDEPGADRWHSFRANAEAFATVLRHPGEPRPWLVCLHGQTMGKHSDIDSLHIRRIHDELGVNVVLPVLPLHGPRRAGNGPDQQFASLAYPVNNAMGLAQSVWDVRRVLAWLRQNHSDSNIGLFGLSLGSYVASLVAGFDSELACLIAVVPTADMGASMRLNAPLTPKLKRAHHELHDWRSEQVHRMVSPLARPCLVPQTRRFIIAGQGDRAVRADGTALLWRHWEQPAIEWLPGGHLTAPRSVKYDAHLRTILRRSGIAG